MKKILLLTLIFLFSSNAKAQWVGIASTDEFITYVDFPPISKNGNLVRMWVVYDLNKPYAYDNNKTFLSIKYQNEFDCNENKFRELFFSFHSSNMGRGETITNVDTPSYWDIPRQDSMESIELTIACGSK